MGQILRPNNIKNLEKVNSTTLKLPSGSIFSIGSRQFLNASDLNCNFSTNGLGGLDTGAIAADTLYYIYLVLSGGSPYLVASTSSLGPLGFSVFEEVGKMFSANPGAVVFPVTKKDGKITTEKVSFTPSPNGGGVVFNSAPSWYWRDGKNLKMNGWVHLNTGTGDIIGLILPENIWLDTLVLTGNRTPLGVANIQKTSGGGNTFTSLAGGSMYAYYGSGYGSDRVIMTDVTTGDGNIEYAARSWSGLLNNGDALSYEFAAPILGWANTYEEMV